MDVATVITLAAAVVTALPVVATGFVTSLRRLARLPRFRGRLAPTLAAVAVTAVVTRPPPAPAVTAPPTIRLSRPVPASPPPATADPAVHVVAPGDTLWDVAATILAERLGRPPSSAEIARFWPRLYVENRDVIGDDPNLILPGQRLRIPEG